MTKLSGDLIRHKLATYTIGQNVVSVEQTGSTNTELKRLARTGAPEGLLYIADEQLVGRGRLERDWIAPAGSSLLISLLFRPSFLPPDRVQQLTMICALAMVEAIEAETGLRPDLKWPNDLIWHDGKKLAGILTEAEFEGNQVSWVVVGVGLNVNIDFSSHTARLPDRPGRPGTGSPPLGEIATSLSMILGRETTHLRLPILQGFLQKVERRYEAIKQGQSPHQEWQARLIGLGQTVTITNVAGNQRWQGKMIGVSATGALQVERADGQIETVLAGDVTLK